MTPNVSALASKSDDAMRLARIAAAEGLLDGAVSRAYYAAFYAARAALLVHGEAPRTHRGVHNRFRLLFVKTGQVPEAVGSTLPFAADLRQKADYDAMSVFDATAVDDLLGDVDRFISAVKPLLST